ncbi:MAG: hypothetical protein JST70_15985 [Bacteroidetes bacterium]|nr:hypothetical protein [Bacteroidota bacterium]
MSTTIKAVAVNESTTNIERNAIRIMLLNNGACDHVKTFPLETHTKNTSILLSVLKEELPPYKKNAYLGIGFVSYENVNLIQFKSTFKSFPLNRGDEFVFYFEDGQKLVFNMNFESKKEGPFFKNESLITDEELDLLKRTDLKYYKLTNCQKHISVIGGFVHQENNIQYSSERTGKKLFKLMAKRILLARRRVELACCNNY